MGNRPHKVSNFQLKGEKVFLNRFYCDKALGRGVQGVVFSAYDTKLKRKVAVKKLLSNNKEDKDQHNREIKVLQHLLNENLTTGFPRIYDYNQNKYKFIVTQLLGDR